MANGTLQGRENVYTCMTCGAILVTVDRDAGVTPYMMRCNEPPLKGCGGDMKSAFYPNGPRPPHIPAPTHEWYAPTPKELRVELRKHPPRVWAGLRDHVKQGGLLIRPIAAVSPAPEPGER